MGIFSLIARRLMRIRRNDPMFGQMLFMGQRVGYWEGKAKIPDETSTEIEIFVDGRPDDDFRLQHEFYNQVCAEWPCLQVEIARAIGRDFGQRAEEVKELTVTSMSIPKCAIEKAEWDISFVCDLNFVTVHMKGREPVQIEVEKCRA